MAKALKTAALVVGAVALVATGVGAVALGGLAGAVTIGGVSASTLFLVSGGLTVASSLLQKAPKVPAAQTDRLNASVDPRAFRKTVLGQTAWPVEIRYEEWSGKDQEYCDWIVLHASHASDGLDEIWFDNELAWSATTGVASKWAGYFSVPHIVMEGSAANAFSIGSGQWNRSARLTGCTYSHWRFKVTGNSKKAESPFSSGLPSRITVIGRGAKLYDPRRDSTVPGGSGPMRADDQSTWRYTADDGAVIGENLALHTLRVALGWRIKNPATGEMRLATGSGVPPRRLNLQSWIVAANLADEQVNRSAGGTEPRYHGACVISEGDDPKASLDMLCTACCGRFRDSAGKLSFTIAHNDLAGAAVDDGLNTDDVVGAFTWDPDAALEATPNIVRGKYVDASINSLYQMIDYPEVRLPSPDGQDRIFPLDLGAVESPSQAQRIAKQVLQRKQYPRRFSAPFDIRAWKYSVGDVLPFTFAPLGFTRVLFRVEEQELGQGGTCNMTLLFEAAVIYSWDKDDAAPVQAAAPIVYDNRNNPLILAIADAGTTAEWPAITGEGKPDDDATNSADPNSPFGPGGTVGGTLDSVAEARRIAAEAKARQDTLDNETIPAINDAVADAGERIAAAHKAADDALTGISEEAARAAREEGRLDERITSVAAAGGYDDTNVRSEISRVEKAYVADDIAIGQRIDLVQSSLDGVGGAIDAKAEEITTAFTKGDQALASRASALEATAGAGGNLVPNSALSTLDGWSVNYNADNLTGFYLNFVGAPYMLGGVENNLTLFRAPAGNGLCAQAVSSQFAVRGGSFVQFYAMTSNHRCNVWTSLLFFRADGSDAGYAGEHMSPRINEGGQNIAKWDQTGSKAVQVPGDAVSACFAMRIYNVSSDGYGWFSRPFVTEVKEGASSWVAYSPGNDRSITAAIGARVKSTEDVLVDLPKSYATAKRAADIEATVGDVSGRVGSVETAVTDGRFATAVRAEQIASYADGIGATVDQQAGTIATIDGKTAAYVRYIATAGNNRAQLTLSADANGGAGVDIVGDVAISGNLLVTGSVYGRNIAPDSISGTASREAGSATFRTTALTTIARVDYVGNGGRAAITFSGVVTLSPGAPAGTRMQAYLSVNGGIRVGPLPVSAVRGSPAPFCFSALVDVSGSVAIELSVQASGAPGSGDPHIVDNPTIILVEMKKLGG